MTIKLSLHSNNNHFPTLHVNASNKKKIKFLMPSPCRNLMRLIERKWNKIFPHEESFIKRYLKLSFVAQKILQNKSVTLYESPSKIASKHDLQKLFKNIHSRVSAGEKNINLELEMNIRGFKPVIRNFKVEASNLIIHQVEFQDCPYLIFSNCWFLATKLPVNARTTQCITFGLNDIKEKVIEIYGRVDYELCAKIFLEGQKNGYGFSRYSGLLDFIQEVKGDGTQIWIDFAKSLSYANNVCLYFHNFGITDQKAIFEIALLYIQTNHFNTNIAANIPNFGITDQNALIKIARLCAECNSSGLTENINKFGITDQQALFEIAQICSKHKHSNLAINIQNFGITNIDFLTELAIQVTSVNPCDAARYIQNFGIKDLDKLRSIALYCVDNHADLEVMSNIKSFIPQNASSEWRFNLIKTIAEKAPYDVAEFIELTQITDQNALIEIALICAKGNSVDLAENIDNFKITDKDKLLQVAKICAEVIVFDSNLFDNFELNVIQRVQLQLFYFSETKTQLEGVFEDKPYPEIPLDEYKNDTLSLDLFSAQKISKDTFKETIDNIKDPYAKKQTLFWLISTTNMFDLALNSQQLSFINNHKFLLHILNIKDPKLRWWMTRLLFEFVIKHDFTSFEQSTETSVSKKAQKKEQAITLTKLITSCKGISAHYIEKYSKKLQDDAIKLNVFLNAYSRLLLDENLSTESFLKIQKKLFEDFDLVQNCLKFITLIYQMNEQHRLYSFAGYVEELMQEIFNAKLNGLISIDDNKTEKLFQFFEESRNPDALLIYITNLKKLNSREIDDALAIILNALIENTFSDVRYDLEKNVHLKEINKTHPLVIDLWKKNSWCKWLYETLNDGEKFNFSEWLHQKIEIDGHYPKEQDHKFQQLCNELLQSDQTKDPVGRILNELLVLAKGTEFENDIKALMYGNKGIISEKNVIVNTDNPMDILLCGTEVLGSCQRVNGDPERNKGLLGYLLNGQTRLIAIKSEEGPKGIILSRCLIRLLWDESLREPVMFLERLYPSNISEIHSRAIEHYAYKKAKELGVKIVSLTGKGAPYPNALSSLGGISPYEYVDAAKGICKESKFQTTNTKYLFTFMPRWE